MGILQASGGGTEIHLGGAGVRGCEAADYPREASMCEGQNLGVGLSPPSSLGSAAFALGFLVTSAWLVIRIQHNSNAFEFLQGL